MTPGLVILRPYMAPSARLAVCSVFTGRPSLCCRRWTSTATNPKPLEVNEDDVLADYKAPLAKTFYRLKLFSLSSLCAAIGLTPALLFAPAEVGLAGRVGLCATALATSGASTAIFAWIGKPYVGGMRLLTEGATGAMHSKDAKDAALPVSDSMARLELHKSSPAIEALTTDWRLRKLRTIIYEPSLIRPTSRPLATWELALTPPANEDGQHFPITKLVAATHLAKTGQLIGRQWVTWPQKSVPGRSTVQGNLVRHFTIHEELLDEKWKIL